MNHRPASDNQCRRLFRNRKVTAFPQASSSQGAEDPRKDNCQLEATTVRLCRRGHTRPCRAGATHNGNPEAHTILLHNSDRSRRNLDSRRVLSRGQRVAKTKAFISAEVIVDCPQDTTVLPFLHDCEFNRSRFVTKYASPMKSPSTRQASSRSIPKKILPP